MKKLFYLFCLLLAAGVAFISCRNDDEPPPPDPSVTDTGVLIGYIDGTPIRWATRNVAARGTFAATPESAGMLFQWNRPQEWNNTDAGIPTDWGNIPTESATWIRANDPCPEGWRVPTVEELRALRGAGVSDWTQLNGVSGRFFGSDNNTIFLPAAGLRRAYGALYNVGYWGYFWSSTQGTNTTTAWGLQIVSGTTGVQGNNNRFNGFSVRCVADK